MSSSTPRSEHQLNLDTSLASGFAGPSTRPRSGSSTIPPADPFDNTTSFADDPFAQPSGSSSSDDDMTSFKYRSPFAGQEDGRRGSVVHIPHQHRSTTDPALEAEAQPGLDPLDDGPPPFHRTLSAPLPSRVGHLRHPHSPIDAPPRQLSFSAPSTHLQTPLQTISLELADTLQSAIQTLLHLSPPHLLDNVKEQYSGCTVQIPTTSLSALLTSMKSLNYLSAHVQTLVENTDPGILGRKLEDFDIGEMLQSVADLLSGQAAQAGVDFVLFHGDVGMKHVSVRGDAQGLSYALGHVLRQILLVASSGDTIELGLQLVPQSPSMTPRVAMPIGSSEVISTARPASPGQTLPSPATSDGPLLCVFEIIHNINPHIEPTTPKAELNPFTRLHEMSSVPTPNFDTILCRRLLHHQNASLRIDTPPSSPLGSGLPRRAYELSVLLPRAEPVTEPALLSAEEEAVRQPFPTIKLAREPSLMELSQFAESLRGRKVVLHASLSSLFARHLTSYLAAWGMDINHIPIEEGVSQEQSSPDSFVMIDDDVQVLRQELSKAASSPLSLKPRLLKRPTLPSRAKSSPHVRRVQVTFPIIIHFTSLANYNRVRDVLSSFGSPYQPEVMVIPKPVGPRRFLTALHTAVSQPIVDPFFTPIATSPRSPGSFIPARTPLRDEIGRDSFFDNPNEESNSSGGSQKARSPLGEFPPSQASIVRTDAGLHLAIPTPGDIVATPASEYFSNSAARAVVMQSPDGRPFGLFFEPPEGRRVPNSRKASERRLTTRRVSEQSQADVIEASGSLSRRTSMRESAAQDSATRITTSRRKTLPTGNSEPILAMGRDRSSTMQGRRRVSAASELRADSYRKADRKASLPEFDELERPGPPQSPRLTKPEVVVPPINVLIVEDNPINQNILSMFLRKKKISHSTAKDGLEAVEKWRTGSFHLILMDIQLPVMDGIEATKEIRALERSNNIGVFPSTPQSEHPPPESDSPLALSFRSSVIIVALTASSLQSDRVSALAAGCNDFLTKPVSLKYLDRKIVEWGCMQALIDFDGWKRWQANDTNPTTKQGFQDKPLAAAQSIAGRLKIKRGPRSSASKPENQGDRVGSLLNRLGDSTPSINVRSPTPHSPGISPTNTTSESPVARTKSRSVSSSGNSPSEGHRSKSSSLSSIHEVSESPVKGSVPLPQTGSEKPLPSLPSDSS